MDDDRKALVDASQPASDGEFLRFVEGDALYQAMLDDIDDATESVRIETYIYSADEIGQRFAEALIERARAGCKVHLRIDAMGSFDTMSTALSQILTAGGVHLEWCRRWRWQRPFDIHRRNHRKLLIVDQRCCYLGGFNLHHQASRAHFGDLRWRDTHLRLSGALVCRAIEAFDEYGKPPLRRRRWRDLRTDQGYLVPNLGLARRFLLNRLLRRFFRSARQRLWLTTPYFVPPIGIQRALIHAARHGADVRVLVPRRSDVALAQWASRAAYAALLARGVRIFEYLPRMLHAKTAVIDDRWTMVGTANLDYRSLFINDELVLLSDRRTLNLELEQDFLQDQAEAEEITAPRWSRRFGLSWIAEFIGWLARRWL